MCIPPAAGSFAYCMFNQTHTMNYGRYVEAADRCIQLCATKAGGEGRRRQQHRWIRTPLEYEINLWRFESSCVR